MRVGTMYRLTLPSSPPPLPDSRSDHLPDGIAAALLTPHHVLLTLPVTHASPTPPICMVLKHKTANGNLLSLAPFAHTNRESTQKRSSFRTCGKWSSLEPQT